MKSEWKKDTLIKYIDLIGGGTPKTSVAEYWNGSIPWLSVKDFNNDNRYVYTTEKHISEQGLLNSSTKLLQKDDIIISARGTVGELAMIPFPMTFNQSCYGIRAKDGLNKAFLYYLLKNKIKELKKITHGSVFDTITRETFSNIVIDIPDYQTQCAIASILGGLDKKIELNNKINDNLEQQAFTLFEKLQLDAHGVKCQVSDIAYLNSKRSLPKNQMARCIDMSQLSTSGMFPSGWEFKPFNGGMRFANGDTLLARITPCLENGKAAYINFLDEREIAFGSTEYIVLSSKEGIPPEFLYCLARYPSFVDFAIKNMNGTSGRQRVSADAIGKFVLSYPTKNALDEFGNVVSVLFSKTKNNSLENLKLAALRDILLPKLMSGEIKLDKI